MNRTPSMRASCAWLAALLVVSAASPQASADTSVLAQRHGVLARFFRDLGRAIPSLARDLAGIDVSIGAGPAGPDVWDDSPWLGARHPDGGAPVCDSEVLGVITSDIATRTIAPIAVRAAGHPDQAARLATLSPVAVGSAAQTNATPLFEIARIGMAVPADPRMRGRYRNSLTRLAWSLRNLGRSRAAPESRVLEAVIEISAVAVTLSPADGQRVVLDLARRSAASVVEAARHRAEARARCVGSRESGAPLVESTPRN